MSAEHEEGVMMPPFSRESYGVLLAPVFGLALALFGQNLTVGHAHLFAAPARLGLLAPFVPIALMAILFAVTLRVRRMGKPAVSALLVGSLALAALSSAASAAMALVPGGASFAYLATCATVQTVSFALIEFYWIRKLRGISAQAAVMVVFGAVALSEVGTLALSVFPPVVWKVAALLCVALQLPVVRASRAMDAPSDSFPAVSELYFGTDENRFSNRSFLITTAVGLWLISIPIGMGIAYDGWLPLDMDFIPRAILMLVVLAVSGIWIYCALRSRMRALTTSIWVVMGWLIAGSCILFAIFPGSDQLGGALSTAASVILTAFVWYITIAFESFGWRDPFYYCTAAWIAVNFLINAGGVFSCFLGDAHAGPRVAIMMLFVLLASQLVFTKLLSAPTQAAESARGPVTEDDVRRIPLMGVMALTPQEQLPMVNQKPDVHIATSVLEMGQRFGLTGREIEVLTLYALGHTQARVSEELQLSPNTVHTHIKRIYDKTDLHSRQEILDYIAEYGSR